jgi:hypothetical protein
MAGKQETVAAAMPDTQLKVRPCDLPPGISMLTMMPITGSLVSEVTYAVVGHAGQIAMGEEFSRASHCPVVVASLPAPFRARKTDPAALPRVSR